MASSSSSWPGLMRPSSIALGQGQGNRGGRGVGVRRPRWRSPGSRRCPGAWRRRRRMRWLAWWGMNQSTSSTATPAGLGRGRDRLGDVDHRVAEHLVALHAQLADLCRWWRGRRRRRAGPAWSRRRAARSPAGRGRPSVPCPSTGSSTTAPGAVAEQHAGAAVGPVHQPRHGLGADHQGALGVAPGHEAVGHRQRVDEARADRLDVEGDADRRAQLALHDGGGRPGRSGRAWWWPR